MFQDYSSSYENPTSQDKLIVLMFVFMNLLKRFVLAHIKDMAQREGDLVKKQLLLNTIN